jgi:hypothetical protein
MERIHHWIIQLFNSIHFPDFLRREVESSRCWEFSDFERVGNLI